MLDSLAFNVANLPSPLTYPEGLFHFSPFRSAVEKLRSEEYDEVVPLCTSEIEQTPTSSYCQLAILLRGTMYSLMSQAEDALTDLNSLLESQDLDKKVQYKHFMHPCHFPNFISEHQNQIIHIGKAYMCKQNSIRLDLFAFISKL